MLAVGMSRKRALCLALLTGLTEVVGTFLGYYVITEFVGLLPVSLAFAGGAMMYVIADEMIPLANKHGRAGTYVFVAGMCLMMLANTVL